MTEGERRVLLDQLRSLEDADCGSLANVRCLTEGVDVPALDGVAFIDSRRSHIDIVQAVGRAIRKSPEKKLGFVVIPVLIPPGADDDEVLDSSDFQKVWEVVRALRAHDDVLAEQLDAARFELGRRHRPGEMPTKVILDLPEAVSPDFARALVARVIESSTNSWEFWFGLLSRYADAHHTATMPHATIVDGYRLGIWCDNQRKRYRAGTVPGDQVARLESLPGWVWGVFEATWERYYELLTTFVKREGTAAVPRNHVEEGEQLGHWVRRQRQINSGVDSGELTKDQIRRLVALTGWSWDLQVEKWERAFRALLSFVAREGHTNVAQRHIEAGVNLGAWVIRQQLEYQKGRLQRQGDRLARLAAVPGWKWWVPVADKWGRKFSALVRFVEREGHAQVPSAHVEDGVTLGNWIHYVRARYASGHLQQKYPERVGQLEALPGWSWNGERRRSQRDEQGRLPGHDEDSSALGSAALAAAQPRGSRDAAA